MLVVLEGVSGAGKTTQLLELQRHLLKDGSTAVIREFSNGPIGRIIANYFGLKQERFVRLHSVDRFADQTYLLLLADVIAKLEEAAKSAAKIILIDRLFDSWFCYALEARNRVALPDQLIRDLYWRCVQEYLPSETITVFLDVRVDTAIERLRIRDNFGVTCEDRRRLKVIAQNFEELYSQISVIRIQAEGEPTEVTAAIVETLGLNG